MVVLSDNRTRALRRGDGLQRLGGDRAAGESQPISLRDQANGLDLARFCRHVRGDAFRLSTIEPALDRLWITDFDNTAAGRGLWFPAGEWGAPVDSLPRILNAAVGNRKAFAGFVSGALY